METYAIILAGGSGVRFWPLSRKKRPKQFVKLIDDGTLFDLTLRRVRKLFSEDKIIIVTLKEYYKYISTKIKNIPDKNIITEPFSRNTALSIGFSAIKIKNPEEDSVMVVIPSDHLIKNESEFENVLKLGIDIAEKGEDLITFGIEPRFPETGYGYIQLGDEISFRDNKIYRVNKFVEKPDKLLADEFLASKNYLWNSGIFVWRISSILRSINTHYSELHLKLMSIEDALNSEREDEIVMDLYKLLPSISIDKAVLEKDKNILAIPCDIGWSDLGSWTSLYDLMDKDEDGNVKNVEHLYIDSKNLIIHCTDKIVVTIGVKNLVIADTEDALLVCSKERVQDIKTVIDKMEGINLKKYT